MAIGIDARKPDLIGKSVRSFNGEAQSKGLLPKCCRVHAAKKNL
jgi:hypothetical protein